VKSHDAIIPLSPHIVPKVWGIPNKELNTSAAIGEYWLVSDITDAQSHQRGQSQEMMQDIKLKEGMFGELATSDLPFLIKRLTLSGPTSLQYHPQRAKKGKKETWIITDSGANALAAIGLKHGIMKEAFDSAIAKEQALSLMNVYPLKKGQCWHIEPGVPHALIGPASLIEVQTPIIETRRLFDFGRRPVETNPYQYGELRSPTLPFPHLPGKSLASAKDVIHDSFLPFFAL